MQIKIKPKRLTAFHLCVPLLMLGVLCNFISPAQSEDVDVKLTTTDGSTKFSIQDAAAAEVGFVDSNGNATFTTVTQTGAGGSYIMNQNTLQSGATFYVSSGTVSGSLLADTYARVGGVIDRNFGNVTSTNENAEHSMYSFSVPANLMGTNRAIHVYLSGTYLNNSAATKTIRLRLKLGATTVLDKTSATNASSATTADVSAEFVITNNGATNAQEAWGQMLIERGTIISPVIDTGTAAEDTTSAKTLDITITHSVANANTTFTKLTAYAVLE